MTETQLLADLLKKNGDFVGMTLSDFSDADMLARPCPGANHAAWQLGHLAESESGSLQALSGKPTEFPFKGKFNRESTKIDDPNYFPRKQDLLDAFGKVRAATVEWVKTLQPADLERQTPEKMRMWAPTVAHLLASTPVHVAMHVGQFQVIRRKLGKPILF